MTKVEYIQPFLPPNGIEIQGFLDDTKRGGKGILMDSTILFQAFVRREGWVIWPCCGISRHEIACITCGSLEFDVPKEFRDDLA